MSNSRFCLLLGKLDYNSDVGGPRRREEKYAKIYCAASRRYFTERRVMRFVHIFVAIGIALIANAIEPAWLGFVALLSMLGIYTFLVIKYLKNKHQS
jgi:hypothetical protein